MHIVIFAATRRGLLFIQKVSQIFSHAKFSVFSFKEDKTEPPFFDSIRTLVASINGNFYEARNVGYKKYNSCWEQIGSIDAAFCVSWRYMIPPQVYCRPLRGTFVFHDSILPKYRGFAPTVWSIINGETHTGVSLMKIAAEVDSGDIVDQQKVPIDQLDSIADVLENVTSAYLEVLEKNIFSIMDGTSTGTPQNHSLATYTVKRTDQDYMIDWKKSAIDVYNLIRGCTAPYPGAFTHFSSDKFFIWEASLCDNRTFETYSPGRLAGCSVTGAKTGISILCGDRKTIFVTKMSRASDGTVVKDDALTQFKLSTTFV